MAKKTQATRSVGVVTGAGSGMGLACASQLADLVDVLILADLNELSITATAKRISESSQRAAVEACPLDITDQAALAQMATRVSESGTLRAVAHAAGISPTMADWRRVLTVDLVGSAMLTETLLPLAVEGTAVVCYGSIAPFLSENAVDPAIDAALDDPLHLDFVDRIQRAVGPSLENPGLAYFWAKRGVHRLVQREAVRFGRKGARVCSVSPGIIDTPMGRLEAEAGSTSQMMVSLTPLGRQGRAEEVAAATTFLLSDAASFVNGIDVLVDGGALAGFRSRPTPTSPPSEGL